MNPHCPAGHCKDLRLPDGAPGRTAAGNCRRCTRTRQARWAKSERGQQVRRRYESTAKAVLRNIRYDAARRHGE